MRIKPFSLLQDVKLIIPDVYFDERGFFLESYRRSFFEEQGITTSFVQENHSHSYQNCLRGMHYQSYPGQEKLVRVISGEIYDVVVDIRPKSPTFGKYEGAVLSGNNHTQIFIPIGFAHGFCVLSKEAHVVYKVSSYYKKEMEKGFFWKDPHVQIEWPIPSPIVSKRDEENPSFLEIDFLQEKKRDQMVLP